MPTFWRDRFARSGAAGIVMAAVLGGCGSKMPAEAPGAASTTAATRAAPLPTLSEHEKWILQVIREIDTIKPGMTRRDLAKLFTLEGGLSTRTQRTYCYRECGFIKVSVHFRPVENVGSMRESEDDVITEVSLPYLQLNIID